MPNHHAQAHATATVREKLEPEAAREYFVETVRINVNKAIDEGTTTIRARGGVKFHATPCRTWMGNGKNISGKKIGTPCCATCHQLPCRVMLRSAEALWPIWQQARDEAMAATEPDETDA